MRLAIYGACGMALGAYKAIKELFPDQEIMCFIVSEKEANVSMLRGIPVMKLVDFLESVPQDERDNVEILIGTPENVMGEIEANLEREGVHNYVRLDSLRWSGLVRDAFLRLGKYLPLSAYVVGCEKAVIHVFKMVHFNDKPLKTQYRDPEYILTLQVGATGSPQISADFRDNIGANISEKNGNYSELTGLYWVWKNYLPTQDENSYYGLAHYRRLLVLSDDDMLRLKNNDIDAVLPYPMPYDPNIEAHHKRYLSDREWAVVLKALRELCPESAEAFESVLAQEYLYNYNIILAKRNVLDEYCSWLFPILFRIEELNDPEGRKTPNRFIGYVAESLETLYFMYHEKKLRIAHMGCRFLV